jgi:hypothetical protein
VGPDADHHGGWVIVLPQTQVNQVVLVAQFLHEGRTKSEINKFLRSDCGLRGAKEITAPSAAAEGAFNSPAPTDII